MGRNWTNVPNDPPPPTVGGFSIIGGVFNSLTPSPLKVTQREVAPDAKCCEKFDQKTKRDCFLCGAPCCNYCRGLFNGQWVCKPCRDEVKALLDAERATWNDAPRALLGGFGIAVLADLGWSALAIGTGLKFSILSILVGLFAGFGAHVATGRKRGFPVQIAAALCGMLSILLGQYVISVFLYNESTGLSYSYFDRKFIAYFVANLFDFIGIFDVCCILTAMAVAFIVPRPRIAAVR